ncbi:MAG: ribosome maturation factor RimM [Gammaproteobacteria bacterium]|nr:ribosome maturation factor RimM [Gammaproteobacteria bacterium]MCY4210891.1 ribosome maturation factor RimM [Gammaproteobacteria bacterium]MCY4282516.1 ribosome maturation factor RimM [Gammaproteobacteria bacterium]MCY4337408.1 ribosome maturation factor RimM [Gammaproteobacteria bacterium]
MPTRAGHELAAHEPGGGESRRRIIIGRISGVHGIRGWLKLFSYTDPKENIFLYQPWLLGRDNGASWTEVEFVDHGASGKTLVVKLPGLEDREAALALVGAVLALSREQLPAPAPGEYYWADLMGMEVVTVTGEDLGRVVDIRATGANDVLIVQGEKRRAIPFVMAEVVRQVDQVGAVITVNWPWD